MTGELCDAFPSRREGVAGLAAIAASHLAPASSSLYAGRAGFVELGEAASHAADIASANWHASAALLALELRDALFIDIGSTTADLIPIVAGRVAALGYSDAERLASGELVYTGMTRSFVMALASRAPFRGAWTPLDERIFRQQRRRPSHPRRLARGRGQNADRRRPRENRRRLAGASCADDRARSGRGRRPGMGWTRRLVCGSANPRNHRRRLPAPVPQRCADRGARRRRRNWRRRRGGGRSPPAKAMRRIFLADRRRPRKPRIARPQCRRVACREEPDR